MTKVLRKRDPTASVKYSTGRSEVHARRRKGHPLTAKFRYWFETFMARGGMSMFISLFILFAICLFVSVAIRMLLIAVYGHDFLGRGVDHIWTVFLEMTDPGSMGIAEDNPYDSGGDAYRWSAVVAGISGVVIFSMLIAFITTQLDIFLAELKKGHSKVIETGHTLILGWNERVPDIIRELLIANESESDPCIVVLAEREKEEMDDELQELIPNTKNTKVVTRNGVTSSLTALERVSAGDAKSAIILATCTETSSSEEKQTSDAKVIKTILALIAASKDTGKKLNIVSELFDDRKRQTLEVFENEQITSLDTWDILGKLLVQTSRTTGLAMVYNEILSFDGCELYFYEEDWGGRKFYDILYHFPDGVPLGVLKRNGQLIIHPRDPSMIMQKGDRVLILAEDDSTIEFMSKPVVKPRKLDIPNIRLENKREIQLILGWHPIARVVVSEYADYLIEGSGIDIMINSPSEEVRAEIMELQEEHQSLAIRLIDKNPMKMEDLISMDPMHYNDIMILSQSEGMHHPEKIDSDTIVILLILRKIIRDCGEECRKTSLITQVMNSDNKDLIARTEVDDFIISNKFITMIMAQISEEPEIKKVYDVLFEESGSEIYLKPVRLYFKDLPVKATYADMMGVAVRREEICLGLRLGKYGKDPDRNFGIKLIPAKDKSFTLREGDFLVVLSEDEL